jgi:nitroreductase
MQLEITNDEITKAVIKSQHCQRNWDLSQEIPDEDLKVLVDCVTQCPSKQNIAFYKAHFITNRETIQAIYDHTDGFTVNYDPYETTKNTQCLANLLVVFEKHDYTQNLSDGEIPRNREANQIIQDGAPTQLTMNIMEHDRQVAVGVAAGYLNLSASLMGYATGCCSCFYPEGVQEVLGIEGTPLLLMGIGFSDANTNRRVHHEDRDFIFPTKKKQPIEVTFLG